MRLRSRNTTEEAQARISESQDVASEGIRHSSCGKSTILETRAHKSIQYANSSKLT